VLAVVWSSGSCLECPVDSISDWVMKMAFLRERRAKARYDPLSADMHLVSGASDPQTIESSLFSTRAINYADNDI
jgi:hypothetical protein